MTYTVGKIPIQVPGSLQNPAFSPDGTKLSFTRWSKRYNAGNASIYSFDFATGKTTQIPIEGEANVSQPGSCWNRRGIIFSSDGYEPEGDRACYWDGQRVHVLHSQEDYQTWEPSWGPEFYVAERHHKGHGPGQIVFAHLNGLAEIKELTGPERDCRQPCVSPDGKHVVFQERVRKDEWRLVLQSLDGSAQERVLTNGTDATFSPDGAEIVFSNESGSLAILHLPSGAATPLKVMTPYSGAPSFSPDGKFIAYEGGPSGDDDGPPSAIFIAPV
jgi:TolB protein